MALSICVRQASCRRYLRKNIVKNVDLHNYTVHTIDTLTARHSSTNVLTACQLPFNRSARSASQSSVYDSCHWRRNILSTRNSACDWLIKRQLVTACEVRKCGHQQYCSRYYRPVYNATRGLYHGCAEGQEVTEGSRSTVFSLSSGHGKCGVAVVRVSGPATGEVLRKIARLKNTPPAREAILRKLVDPHNGIEIDRALVLYFPGPQSFTGEDCAEFQIHGGPAVISALLTALHSIDTCRQAEPGEFTKRAFANGKLDLTEVEGLGDLIHAETEAQRRQALRQMDGCLSQIYQKWRKDIIKCVADLEAFIDFSEDQHIEEQVVHDVQHRVSVLHGEIARHLDDNRQGERLREGVHVVIVGEPNVGKSSLLNAICQRPAAIVTDIAGTTRDIIESHVNIAGYPVLLSDTAGLHDATDTVEKEGVARAMKRASQADLKVILLDINHFHDARMMSPVDNIDVWKYVYEQIDKLGLCGKKESSTSSESGSPGTNTSKSASEDLVNDCKICGKHDDSSDGVGGKSSQSGGKHLCKTLKESVIVFNKSDLVDLETLNYLNELVLNAASSLEDQNSDGDVNTSNGSRFSLSAAFAHKELFQKFKERLTRSPTPENREESIKQETERKEPEIQETAKVEADVNRNNSINDIKGSVDNSIKGSDVQDTHGYRAYKSNPEVYNLDSSSKIDEGQNQPDLEKVNIEGRLRVKDVAGICFISCETGYGLVDLLDILKENVAEMCGNPLAGHPSITQARHRSLLLNCLNNLHQFNHSIEDGDVVVASELLRWALRDIGKLTGRVTTEEILDVIFKDFCIGK